MAEKKDSISRLRQLAAALAEATTAAEVASAIVGPAVDALAADLAAFSVPMPDRTFLRLAGSKGLSAETEARLALIGLDAQVPISDAFRTGKMVFLEGVATFSRYAGFSLHTGTQSAVAAPIIARGKPIGALGFGFRKARRFTDDDVVFLQDVSALAGVALERAALLEAERSARGAAELERARLREVLDQLPVGVMIAGPTGELAFANRRAQQIFGAPIPQPSGAEGYADTFTAWGPDGHLLSSEEYPLVRALHGQSFEDAEVRFLRADGARPVITANGAPLLAPGGAIEGAVVTYFDVSERRQAEEERAFLAEAGATLAGSFDYGAALARVAWLAVPRVADYCLVDLVEQGVPRRVEVAHASPDKAELASRMRKFTSALFAKGRSAPWDAVSRGEPVVIEQLDPARYGEFTSGQEHQRAAREVGIRSLLLLPLAARGQTLGLLTLIMADSGRAYRPAHLTLAAELARTASTAIDNALLFAEAERARGDAETANRAKDEFLAMLGHELRNPLAPIVTALDLMKLRGEQGWAHERKIIERQVQSLMTLVDDLLDVSRITRGKVEIKRRALELSAAVAKALETASPLLEQRRHAVHVEVPRTGLAVEGDETRLAQVFANLLTNAARYTEPGGNVWISARRFGSNAVIEVKDDGIGVPAELIPTIFELFVQGQKTIERAEGGLGLGLALVRSLVRLHGGEVTARSEGMDRGSTFTVELPALPDDARVATPLELRPARAHRPGEERRVLVVDDNEDAAGLLAMALRDAGYRVEVAFDGAQALERLGDFAPQLAVLDIGLPVMDGYELAARLRERVQGVRLIALTGYGQQHDRERSLRAGFDLHLVKPVDLDSLLAALDRPG